MGAMSRRKGATFERELARRWRESRLFPQAERGLSQTRDGGECCDVEGTPYWIEAKRRERGFVESALEQAERARAAAGDARPVVVVTKRNRAAALASMRVEECAVRLVDAWHHLPEEAHVHGGIITMPLATWEALEMRRASLEALAAGNAAPEYQIEAAS